MTETEMVDWRVPATEWEKFRDYVEEKYGSTEGYLGREAEIAMREYTDTDGFQRVEERVDRLVKAAGRTPEALCEENKSLAEDGEKTRVTARVAPEVKDDFRAVAKKGDDTYGVAFAKAIRARREGGRADRLVRKLDRIVDDAEALLGSVADSGTEKSLSHVEKNVIAIANELEGQFTNDELERTISEVANVTTDKSISDYRVKVIDRLDYEPHPNNSDLWIPSSTAEEYADGAPRKCRLPVDILSSPDRVERIRLAVGRYAATRGTGKARVESSKIREKILDREVTKTTTLDLMKTAAQVDGITLDENGSSHALRVDLKELGEREPDLFEKIIEYRDATEGGLLSNASGNTTSRQSWNPTERREAKSDGGEEDVDAEFDMLNQATKAVADGGTETIDDSGC